MNEPLILCFYKPQETKPHKSHQMNSEMFKQAKRREVVFLCLLGTSHQQEPTGG